MNEDNEVASRVAGLAYEIVKAARMFAYDNSNVQVGATVLNVEITARFEDCTYRNFTTLNLKI